MHQLIDESCTNGNQMLELLDNFVDRRFDLLIDDKGEGVFRVYPRPHLTYN